MSIVNRLAGLVCVTEQRLPTTFCTRLRRQSWNNFFIHSADDDQWNVWSSYFLTVIDISCKIFCDCSTFLFMMHGFIMLSVWSAWVGFKFSWSSEFDNRGSNLKCRETNKQTRQYGKNQIQVAWKYRLKKLTILLFTCMIMCCNLSVIFNLSKLKISSATRESFTSSKNMSISFYWYVICTCHFILLHNKKKMFLLVSCVSSTKKNCLIFYNGLGFVTTQ